MSTYDWSSDVFNAMRARRIASVATIPDGGLTRFLQMCSDDPDTRLITLTTEEEGIGIVTGLWLGGQRGMIAMQSSGIGNCINALGLPGIMRAPCLMLVTMRGEWGEFNPWQVAMGRCHATGARSGRRQMLSGRPGRGDRRDLRGRGRSRLRRRLRAAAVLVSQRVIGAKGFGR